MTDVLFYHNYMRSWFESLISALLLISVNLYIRKYGKKHANEIKSSKLVVLGANINIIIQIAILFMPHLELFNEIQINYNLFKIYYILVQLIVPISSFITLGIFFLIIGIKNNENSKSIPIATGVSISISYLLQIITTIIYGIFLLDYFVYHLSYSIDFIWFIYTVLVNLSITTYLFGIAVLLGQAKMNDLKLLSSAMLIMIVHFVIMTNFHWIVRDIKILLGLG